MSIQMQRIEVFIDETQTDPIILLKNILNGTATPTTIQYVSGVRQSVPSNSPGTVPPTKPAPIGPSPSVPPPVPGASV